MTKIRFAYFICAVWFMAVSAVSVSRISSAQEKEVQGAKEELKALRREMKSRILQAEQAERTMAAKTKDIDKKEAALKKEMQTLTKESGDLYKENAALKLENRNMKTGFEKLNSAHAKLKRRLKIATRVNYLDKKEIERLHADVLNLNARISKLNISLRGLEKDYGAAKRESSRLRSVLTPVYRLKKKLAAAYQQLGTAYTQLKKFDLAVDAFKKSIAYYSENPTAHYNIGLLYQHSRSDTQKAIYHLNRYLELSPDAKDRREIKFIIRSLSEVDTEDNVFFN